jgi:hypothetical protein
MKNLILSLTLSVISTLATISAASAQDYAKDCLPSCDSAAKVVIFNGASFDGTIYLHDTDVQLSQHQVKAVKAIAANGQTPVICLDSDVLVVTANN